jgi:molybdenum cofactor biosynthesis enzyme
MVRMADVTHETPMRRMSVARGVLSGAPADLSLEVQVAARTAAVMAVKDSARIIPTAVPFSPTDTFCDLACEDGRWVATVTVVAYARATLEAMALAGVGTALLSLWDAVKLADPSLSGLMRIEGMELVQNVDG